jgi:hypothetical protein
LALYGGEWSASQPWLLHPQGKSPWYPLDRRLDGPKLILHILIIKGAQGPPRAVVPRKKKKKKKKKQILIINAVNISVTYA